MTFTELRFFVGASLYAKTPVCRLRLTADSSEVRLDAALPVRFIQRGVSLFPPLRTLLDLGDAPKEQSRHIGDVLLALIEMLAAEVRWVLGFRAVVRSPDCGDMSLDLVFSYESRDLAGETVRFAVVLLQRMQAGDALGDAELRRSMIGGLQNFVRQSIPRCWSADMRYLVTSAQRRDIPVEVIDRDLMRCGHGRNKRQMFLKTTPNTSYASFRISSSKRASHVELARVGLPVPRFGVASDRDAALTVARSLGFPLVVKPDSTNMGVGITIGVESEQALLSAFDLARTHASLVLLEQFIPGDEFRLLVVGGQLIAAAKRVPAHVVGNGRDTIVQLLQQQNRDPRRGPTKLAAAEWILLDQNAESVLADAGLSRGEIPRSGQFVYLRKVSNLSRGGTSVDVSSRVHPDNTAAALLAAQVLGLDIAGVDFLIEDISRSWKDTGGAICEVNLSPGLRMHFAPFEGEPRDVAGPILQLLYPPGHRARIPVAAVTGSNGKTTTTRMAAHILREAGACVGVTCTDGVYVDAERVHAGDLSGGPAAQQLLCDPRIDAAVLEIARGAILKYGTGVDCCDVAVVTNVADEHLGEYGVHTREDMAKVKGLLVGLARKMVILGADDPLTAGLVALSRAAQVCYVSMLTDNSLVNEHIAAGQPAVRFEQLGEQSYIALYDEGRCAFKIPVDELTVSVNGKGLLNVHNAMFAAALTYGMGYGAETITPALRSFGSDERHNPGRASFIEGLPCDLVLDLCHNRHGLAALGSLIDRLKSDSRTLVFSMPGNRRDEDYLLAMQEASRHFDCFHLFPLSGSYLRGRTAPELTQLMANGLRAAGVADQSIAEHPSQLAALNIALADTAVDELVVVATLEHEAARQQIDEIVGARGMASPHS